MTLNIAGVIPKITSCSYQHIIMASILVFQKCSSSLGEPACNSLKFSGMHSSLPKHHRYLNQKKLKILKECNNNMYEVSICIQYFHRFSPALSLLLNVLYIYAFDVLYPCPFLYMQEKACEYNLNHVKFGHS